MNRFISIHPLEHCISDPVLIGIHHSIYRYLYHLLSIYAMISNHIIKKLYTKKVSYCRYHVRSNIYYHICQKTSDPYRDFGKIFNLPDPSRTSPSAVETRRQMPIDNSTINPYSSTIIYVSTKSDADTLAKY